MNDLKLFIVAAGQQTVDILICFVGLILVWIDYRIC